jgi:hypothetical protein
MAALIGANAEIERLRLYLCWGSVRVVVDGNYHIPLDGHLLLGHAVQDGAHEIRGF